MTVIECRSQTWDYQNTIQPIIYYPKYLNQLYLIRFSHSQTLITFHRHSNLKLATDTRFYYSINYTLQITNLPLEGWCIRGSLHCRCFTAICICTSSWSGSFCHLTKPHPPLVLRWQENFSTWTNWIDTGKTRPTSLQTHHGKPQKDTLKN